MLYTVKKFRNNKQYYNSDWFLPSVAEHTLIKNTDRPVLLLFKLLTGAINALTPAANTMGYGYDNHNTKAAISSIMSNGSIAEYSQTMLNRYYSDSSNMLVTTQNVTSNTFVPYFLLHKVGPQYDGSQQIGSLKWL